MDLDPLIPFQGGTSATSTSLQNDAKVNSTTFILSVIAFSE